MIKFGSVFKLVLKLDHSCIYGSAGTGEREGRWGEGEVGARGIGEVVEWAIGRGIKLGGWIILDTGSVIIGNGGLNRLVWVGRRRAGRSMGWIEKERNGWLEKGGGRGGRRGGGWRRGGFRGDGWRGEWLKRGVEGRVAEGRKGWRKGRHRRERKGKYKVLFLFHLSSIESNDCYLHFVNIAALEGNAK